MRLTSLNRVRDSVRRRGFLIAICICALATPSAQQSEPRFEVASVRENRSGETRYSFSIGVAKSGLEFVPGVGPVVISNAPLRAIIARAYGIVEGRERFALVGEQPILERRFDIAAPPPPEEILGARAAMLKSLLIDRFKLKMRNETRDMPVYALVRARKDRLGPDLRPSKIDCTEVQRRSVAEARELRAANGDRLCNGGTFVRQPGIAGLHFAGSIDVLVRLIQFSFDQPLVDSTGLDGLFEWSLAWGGQKDGPTILMKDALQEQLGLKIERRTAPRDLLVIESVDMPTPN